MKFTVEQIVELYRAEAAKHGDSGTSTIQDMRTRRLEMDALFACLRDGLKVLEVGCGNGFVAHAMVDRFDIDLDAIDFSPDLIAVAKQRTASGTRGRVSFAQGDILTYRKPSAYDLVYSERCIQNLVSWEEQQKGLRNIVASLKSGGTFVMLESFWTGLNNLNAARAELGLEPIAESWHNIFFHEDQTKEYLDSIGCRYVDQNCFLSGYYFGSRVLLPALLPEGKQASSTSILNEFFSALPAAGDFCPMKIMLFEKGTGVSAR